MIFPKHLIVDYLSTFFFFASSGLHNRKGVELSGFIIKGFAAKKGFQS